MKRLFFSLVITSLFFTCSYAQTDGAWKIGFGISPGIPTSAPFKYTLGGDIRLQKDFSNTVSGTLTAGFTHFFEKDHFAAYNQYGSPYNVIPVKAGVKVFLSDNFYIGGEAGVGFGFEQWGNSFLYSPSVGIAFKNGLDLSLKYEDYTRDKATKDISLRLAYGISPRKLAFHKKTDAATGWQWGAGISAGETTNAGNRVLGAEGILFRHLTSNLDATFSVGVTHIFDNSYNFYYSQPNGNYTITHNNSGQTIIPVKAGLRLYAGNLFYVAGDAGAAFASNGNTAFAYSGSMGLAFKSGVDIGVKYDGYAGFFIPAQVAFKAGYRFK